MTKQWVSKFKKGCTNTSEAPRSGCPFEVATPEMIDKISKMAMKDCRLKASARAETIRNVN
jgi:hypothetical protein